MLLSFGKTSLAHFPTSVYLPSEGFILLLFLWVPGGPRWSFSDRRVQSAAYSRLVKRKLVTPKSAKPWSCSVALPNCGRRMSLSVANQCTAWPLLIVKMPFKATCRSQGTRCFPFGGTTPAMLPSRLMVGLEIGWTQQFYIRHSKMLSVSTNSGSG